MVTVLTDAATGSIAPSFRWVVFALVGLAFLLDACVILFNRPRFLVPPDLRSEPGLMGRSGEADRASARRRLQ